MSPIASQVLAILVHQGEPLTASEITAHLAPPPAPPPVPVVAPSVGPRVAEWAEYRVSLYGGGEAGATRLLRSVLGLDIAEPPSPDDLDGTEEPPPDVPGLVGLFVRILRERPLSRLALFPHESGSDERKLRTLVEAGLVLLSGQRVPTLEGIALVHGWPAAGGGAP